MALCKRHKNVEPFQLLNYLAPQTLQLGSLNSIQFIIDSMNQTGPDCQFPPELISSQERCYKMLVIEEGMAFVQT